MWSCHSTLRANLFSRPRTSYRTTSQPSAIHHPSCRASYSTRYDAPRSSHRVPASTPKSQAALARAAAAVPPLPPQIGGCRGEHPQHQPPQKAHRPLQFPVRPSLLPGATAPEEITGCNSSSINNNRRGGTARAKAAQQVDMRHCGARKSLVNRAKSGVILSIWITPPTNQHTN